MKADINDVDPAYLKCQRGIQGVVTRQNSYFVLKIFFGFDEYIWKTFVYQSETFRFGHFGEKTDFSKNYHVDVTQNPLLLSYDQNVELVELPPFKELTFSIQMSIWIVRSKNVVISGPKCLKPCNLTSGVDSSPTRIDCSSSSTPQDFYPHLKCSESKILSYSFKSIVGNFGDTSSNMSLAFPFDSCGGNGAFVEANLLIVRTVMPASVSGSSYNKGDSLTSGYIGVIVFAVLELFAIIVMVGWMFRKRLDCKRVGSVDQNIHEVSMVEEE